MKRIVFASQNENKVEEIRRQLQNSLEILSLNDIGHTEELAEDQDDLKGNALQKARFVKENLGYDCFADDTGLEIFALGGEPGVRSARYAGEEKDANANMEKVLDLMQDKDDRRASFKTVIALILGGKEYLFEGVCEGTIIREKRGEKGFGYDPIFVPKSTNTSFAEMSFEEKAEIGHRGKAIDQLISFLNEL